MFVIEYLSGDKVAFNVSTFVLNCDRCTYLNYLPHSIFNNIFKILYNTYL